VQPTEFPFYFLGERYFRLITQMALFGYQKRKIKISWASLGGF
jgi:hypothetical protein